jgi:amino acid adenylation domain-containing protein
MPDMGPDPGATPGAAPGPTPRAWAFQASFAQERVWLASQRQPGSPLYTLVGLISLPFRVEAADVEAALREVVRRHEALRTCFRVDGGTLVQVVHDTVPVEAARLDLSGLPPAEREERLARLHADEGRVPIPLDRAPLWRARLLRFAEADWRLIVAAHHAAFDATSFVNLWAELTELCRAVADGRTARLPELPIQYADYAVWQRQRYSGEALDGHLRYWRERLAGLPAVHAVPTDRPRPAVPSRAGDEVRFDLPDDVTARVEELARQHRASPFMVLLAAWAALLSRLSGQADVVVGVPVAGRDLPELAPLIGMFVNQVVVRVDAAGEPSFAELLGRVRDTVLDAWEHQDTPFQLVVEALAPARERSVAPLYQIGFNYVPRSGIGDSHGAAEDDLMLDLGRREGRLEYATDLFDAATARVIAGRYLRLLAAAVRDPGTILSGLELLDPGERALVVRTWNATAADYPAEATLHELVAAQAARTPEATAVIFEGERLSYADLDARAERLSGILRGWGVGPETLVGVCAERSPELVVGLLGVLKAGGAYVPLDPEYPAERLAFMLADAAVPVLLTQRRLLGRLPASTARVLVLDNPAAMAGRQEPPGAPAGARVLPENMAYVIYTSGSTGRPKGVANTHRGIVNRLVWMQHAYRLGPDDVVLQKTPASFDVSVWEFFWPLLAGARLVLARPGGHRDPAYLRELIVRERVTTAHFVPSMLAVFLAEEGEDGAERCGSLRRVICSGEELPVALARRFLARLPGSELHNLYGPTEAAVDVSAWRCDPVALAGTARVPIGGPIHNLRLYVLDRRMGPVPVGVVGELYLGGVGLARGYLARPALTAERFVPDPFGPSGSRLYRTGDLARWRPDGTVEFLGRVDNQVKLRGLRIELGEIEAALLGQPEVSDAAVVVRRDPPDDGEQRLVAYLATGPDPAPDPDPGGGLASDRLAPDRLREALRRVLPDYMVPSAFVTLDALPLSPSGKLDRTALPPPLSDRKEGRHAAPRSASEELVASVFAEVLGVERVGVDDDFFDLGGHSLLALRVVARLSEVVATEVGVHLLFASPTVAALAAALEALLLVEIDELSDDEAERLLAEDWR